MRHSIFLPMGFGHEFAGVEPVAAFEVLTDLTVAGDELGFETAWVMDHFQTVPPSAEPLFECWTMVAAFLRSTRRHADRAARHRQQLPQPGAAGEDGVDRRRHRQRPAHLRDRRRLVRARLRHVRLRVRRHADPSAPSFARRCRSCSSTSRRRSPVLIAGAGEKVTLKLVAQYGDPCNMIESPDGLERKFAILRDHCEAVGRDYDEIQRTSVSLCIFADTDEEARRDAPGAEFAVPGRRPRLRADRHARDDPPRLARTRRRGSRSWPSRSAGRTHRRRYGATPPRSCALRRRRRTHGRQSGSLLIAPRLPTFSRSDSADLVRPRDADLEHGVALEVALLEQRDQVHLGLAGLPGLRLLGERAGLALAAGAADLDRVAGLDLVTVSLMNLAARSRGARRV